jgi:flagella basal body P-ring formation protein FlgA
LNENTFNFVEEIFSDMDEKGIKAIIRDIQASPTECEWVEIKHDNEDPESIEEGNIRVEVCLQG